jgi:hypothetical protein
VATDNATGEAPEASRLRELTRSTPLTVAGIVVLVFALAAVVWHSASGHQAPDGAMSISHGPNGKLTIGVDGSGQISATAQPGSGHGAPDAAFRLDPATHVLTLTCTGPQPGAEPVACPAADYAVLVPAHVGVTLHELSGQATLTGLSGPVTITATSADTTATALNTADFTADITSGTLDATFTTAPAHIALSVTSAQAALHLPGTVSYAVRQRSVSADIQVAVPQSTVSAHTVQATATSGSIDLTTGG